MNKIYKLSSAALVALSLASCNDWLDGVENTSSVDDVAVFDTETTVDYYIDGFYTWIGKYGQLDMDNYQFNGSWTEAMTDVLKYSGSFTFKRAGIPNTYAELAVPMSPDANQLSCWDNAYSAIRRVNQFLTLEEKYAGKYNEKQRNTWRAQARFFRAFMNFQLAKRHGGSIILFDALPDGPNKARSSAEEVWDFIEKDLDFAAENLPDSWNNANRGRITKYAALAFKSRAMLYAERWQKAYDAANKVITEGPYDLVDSYVAATAGGNKESIIECRYDALQGPNTQYDFYYSPSTDNTGACGAAPTQNFVECYEKADGSKVDWDTWKSTTTTVPPYDQLEPRFAATVLYPGCTWKGQTLDMSVQGPNVIFFDYNTQTQANGNTCTGYLVRKFLNPDMKDVIGMKSAQPWVELRFAEVLLNFAEAAYNLNKMDDARGALNRVRARVGLPAKASTGNGFLNDYRNERKIELAFEGQLYWDMVRWKLCATEYNNYRRRGVKVNNGTYTIVEVDYNTQYYSDKCYILPVPQSEINNNNLIEQYDNWR
ncbi:MAG: RagB/SusD family nutrient uptake outer membrane protein [Muribaculaceae bacterium]|nr:RagB/SusD family nutrient uptake outer membrane protein [Muribaculaceae bacterium]